MLKEVEKVFTESDNEKLEVVPDEAEVKEVLSASNLLAAPGTDGIPSLLYHECWHFMNKKFTEVVQAIFKGSQPSISQRTSIMVFGSKPQKIKSLKPGIG